MQARKALMVCLVLFFLFEIVPCLVPVFYLKLFLRVVFENSDNVILGACLVLIF